jgi:hypothetical protein
MNHRAITDYLNTRIVETIFCRDVASGTRAAKYDIGGKPFIVVYCDDGSWDVYILACQENHTGKTLAALDEYLK